MTDPIVHIPITPADSAQHCEAHVYADRVWITQSEMDGLHSLILWLDGFRAGSNTGQIPGHHELVMHYRKLISDVRAAIKKRDEPTENAS